MKTKLVSSLIVLTMLAFALRGTSEIAAQTTNGNGGTTDVGTWDENTVLPLDSTYGNNWNSSAFGINDLPLSYWNVSGYTATYQQYDGADPNISTQDMAALAAAKVDFVVIDMTNGGLGGQLTGNDFTAIIAGEICQAAYNWNASNSWKIRVVFAIGTYWVSDSPSTVGPVIETQAQDVWQNYVLNSSYGGEGNWYQFSSVPVLVVYGPTYNWQSDMTTYCGSNDCTYYNNFHPVDASNQGAGQWGWALLPPSETPVNSLAEEVSPGWIPYHSYAPQPRNDGISYANDWNVVFNSPPRVVIANSYNDWVEQQGWFPNDTLTPQYYPSSGSNILDQSGSSLGPRLPEVWTFPDGNVTLDGYYNFTKDAICYLRNGTSTACPGGTSPAPYLPQAAPNLAVSATATASSCALSGCSDPSFQASNANDGNPGSAWSSELDSAANTTESLTLTWTSAQTFNTVALVGRNVPLGDSNGFPVSFEIQYCNGGTGSTCSGGTWTTLVQETDFPQPTIPGQPIAFTWGSSVTTAQVRVVATTLGLDPGGNYYFQLGEFEVMNEGPTPTAPKFANWGFESPAQYGFSYQSGPFTNGWTFNSAAGVQEVSSTFDSPMAPQGVQTAYLTGSSSSISQAITLPAGNYSMRFLASETDGQSQTINVSYGSTNIGPSGGPFGSFPSTGFAPYVTSSFTSTGAGETITFSGAGSGTAFIDEVQIFNETAINAAPSNLLTNPTWSSDSLSSWSEAYANGGSSSNDTLSSSGTYNSDPYLVEIYNSSSSTADNAVYQTVSGLTPGQIATASVWVETASTAAGAGVSLQDAGTGTYLCYFTLPAGVSNWTQFSCSYPVPSDGEINYQFFNDQSSTSDWAKFDSPSLSLGYTPANQLSNPTWSSDSLSSWNEAYANGGSSSNDTLSSSGTYNGDPYLVEIYNSSSSTADNAVYQTVSSLTPGHIATASVWTQTASTAAGAGVSLQDAGTGTYLCYFTLPAGVSNWTQFSCSYPVPSDGEINYQFFNDQSSTSDWAKFDSPILSVQ